MLGRLAAAGSALAVAAVGLFGAPAVAAAGEVTVTTTRDCAEVGCGSIRAALGAVADGDRIRIPAGEYRVDRELVVDTSVTLAGDGAGRTLIVGTGGRVLRVGDPQAAQRVQATFSRLEVAGGVEPYGPGGNILNYADLRLDRVRVRDGRAGAGGGVANLGGTLLIDRSLVDHNTATSSDGLEEGGGVYSASAVPDALVVRDSTIAYNSAGAGAGLAVDGASEGQERAGLLERVTVARNRAIGATPGGLQIDATARVQATGTLLAENTATVAAASAAERPSNCDGPARPVDHGGNLADTADCGFAAPPADPRLSGDLVTGLGEVPLLTIAPGSPALDLAGGVCAASDQRGVARPQGVACDAGAYELAAPAIEAAPAGLAAGVSATFAFSSDAAGATFECRLDGPAGTGTWTPCASPTSYGALVPGTYVFTVRVVGASAQTQSVFNVAAPLAVPPPPPATIAVAPAQVPPPQPRYRRSVVARPTKGSVRVRLPGTTRYVDLERVGSVPLGASIDVRKGRVRLYAVPGPSGRVQAASFYGGVFRVAQRGRFIELQLRGPVPVCARSGARASADKPKKRRKARTRRLWGSGKGAFRTRGRYSAATVRGTVWLVQDSCRSTTTRVRRGVVTVRDFERGRTIRLRAGGRYVARR